MLSDVYISVSDLNSYLKTYIEGNYFLQDLYIKGEVSNFKRHQSGTLYFAIKDEKSRLSVVMFPQFANKLKVAIKDGDMVMLKGRLSVFEANGSYSLQAVELIYDSIGMLYIKYEELKQKLEKEGLFDTLHKKPLPKYPEVIGIITASTGAAIHDMVRAINNRWNSKIVLFPCLVQGQNAAADIANKINIADKYGCDIIICGRGGGSIEDLWPFNEEVVARAIYSCNTPIISAVGHQSDFTIADFVADVRALTPTDGAIKATPDKKEIANVLNVIKDRLINDISNIINNKKLLLKRLSSSYVLLNPDKIYEVYRYKLDDLLSRLLNENKSLLVNTNNQILNLKQSLTVNINNLVNLKKHCLINYTSKLDAMSPLKVLNRGYSYTTLNNKAIKNIKDVKINDEIKVELNDGIINTKIINIKEK